MAKGNSGRQWTKEETDRLISRLEEYPELWDVSSNIYHDRNKKAVSSTALANEFATDSKEIGRKLHNLRTQLNSELRKMKKKRTGSGTDDVYKSGWQFFDALKFMVPSSKIQEQTTSNLEYPGEDGDSQQSSDPLPPPPPTKKKNLAQKEDEILDSALQLLQTKDDDQIFGDFVASALRNLQSPHLKKSLKLKIQRAVLEVEEMESQNVTVPSTPMYSGSSTPCSWNSDIGLDPLETTFNHDLANPEQTHLYERL